jgi:predicted ribosome quality control (RQC) complex YloA/Tae2 family protein
MLPPPAPGLLPSPELDMMAFKLHVEATYAAVKGSFKGSGPFAHALNATFQGTSASLSRELCMRAGVPVDAQVESMSADVWEALHKQWLAWVQMCSSGMFNPTQDDISKRLSVLGSYSTKLHSIHDAIDALYATAQAEERFEQLRATLSRAVRTAKKKLQGKRAALLKQLGSAEQVDETQKRADLIMANVYQWPKNSLTLDVDDWESGEACGTLHNTVSACQAPCDSDHSCA